MAKVELNKEILKEFKVPYELLPTEKGEASPQIVRVYDNCLYLKFYASLDLILEDEEGEKHEDNYMENSISTIDKYLISSIILSSSKIIQLDENGNEVEYDKAKISINMEDFCIWFPTYDEAIEVFNYLINWKYNA